MKIDRTTQLQRALEQLGRDPARVEELLDQVIAQAGAGSVEERAALRAELQGLLGQGDRFSGDQRATIEALLDRRLPRTVQAPTEGMPAHVVRARKHKPWFGAVVDKPRLPAPLFPEPPRDVEVAGQKLTRDELLRMLRGAV